MGNGYITVKKQVGSDEDVCTQCTMCKSQGELDENSFDNNVINFNKEKIKKFTEENEIVFTLDDNTSDATNDNGMEFIFELGVDDA